MTLKGGYELGFALACTSALLIVLLGGELPFFAWLSIAAVWLGGRAHMDSKTAPAWVGTAIGFAGLAFGFWTVMTRGTDALILSASIAIVGLLTGRVITRTALVHDLQSLLLTLLLVFAGAGLNTAISYGAAFVIYAITAVWALVTRQLVEGAHREADRRGGAAVETTMARRDVVTITFFAVSGVLSLIILSGTLVLFLAFPRVGIGSFGVAMQGRRLPDRVSLSSPPRAAMSSEIVARVTGLSYIEYGRGLYLRAATYDRLTKDGFDRRGRSVALGPRDLQKQAELGPVRRYEVFLQPVAGSRLLTLGPAERIRIRSGGNANPSFRARIHERTASGDVYLDAPLTGPIRYSVQGNVVASRPAVPQASSAPIPAAAMRSWLELPDAIDSRVVELAKQVTQNAQTPYQKAVALRRWFLNEFQYTLEQPTSGSSDPLTEFVLEARAGHCEHFATAFATMLRSVGVPARVIGGFQGGVWDEVSDTVVFGLNNAHAWIEWYQPGVGWVLDDATPPFEGGTLSPLALLIERARRAWDDYVLDYGLMEQRELATKLEEKFGDISIVSGLDRTQLQRISLVLLLAALLIGALVMFRRRRTSLRDDALALAIQRALESARGRPLEAHLTFPEAAAELTNVADWRGALLLRAIDHYEKRRFGGASYDVNTELELVRALEGLQRHAPARAA